MRMASKAEYDKKRYEVRRSRKWLRRLRRDRRRAAKLNRRAERQAKYAQSIATRARTAIKADRVVANTQHLQLRDALPAEARPLLDELAQSYTNAENQIRGEIQQHRVPPTNIEYVPPAKTAPIQAMVNTAAAPVTALPGSKLPAPGTGLLVDPNYKGMTAAQAEAMYARLREQNKYRDFSSEFIDKHLGTTAQIPPSNTV